MELSCPTCLTSFKIKRCLAQHKCSISLCAPGDKPDMEVRGNSETNRLMNGFLKHKDSTNQIIRFCYATGTALPGLGPLFFPSKHTPPVLSLLGCVEDSYSLLRAAAQESPVKLLKGLKIKIAGKVLLVTKNLTPTSSSELKKMRLRVVDKPDHVIVYHVGVPLQVSIAYSLTRLLASSLPRFLASSLPRFLASSLTCFVFIILFSRL